MRPTLFVVLPAAFDCAGHCDPAGVRVQAQALSIADFRRWVAEKTITRETSQRQLIQILFLMLSSIARASEKLQNRIGLVIGYVVDDVGRGYDAAPSRHSLPLSLPTR